ncbi:MAG: ABC transporter permease [Propionibacteriaceae bacterium]|nr:ABC transporter permease [Propionibacteriaceae bacterium]
MNGLGAFLRRIVRSREISIVIAFVVIVAATTSVNSHFLFSADGWKQLLINPTMLVALAIGEAFVIITKSFDLSVGSVLGLTAFMVGSMYLAWPQMPVIVAFLFAIALGTLLGFVNGGLVALAKVPGMVITLGTMYIYRGIDILWAGTKRINATNMSQDFLAFGNAQILTIPALAILAVVVLAGASWYLRNMRSGREFYAIGSAPDAAELCGLAIGRRRLAAFTISGAMAGLAGAMFAARYGTVASDAGTGFELQAIGAAVIGGVAIVGGSGTVIGAALGALLLTTINSALPVLGISSLWQQAVVGILIIGAITLDRTLAARRARLLVAERMRT